MNSRDAEKLANTLFGKTGTAIRLPGEYDSNFHLVADDHSEYLLKISHPDEMETIIEMQNSVLLWLAASKRPFDFPRLQKTLSNEYFSRLAYQGNQILFVRLFSFVPGKLLVEVAGQSNELMENMGHKLGQLSVALHQFQHPAAKRKLKWDLMQAAWIKDKLHVIQDVEDSQCVSRIVDHFITTIQPALAKLRQSVIHNDANDYNTLVSKGHLDKYFVSGFIDFGDMVETATICELAIAITYAILDNATPLEAALDMVKGYHAVFPLHEEEVSLLFDLIRIRLCVSVVNSAIRKQENPDDAYLTISERPAWKLLKKMSAMDASEVTSQFKEGCQFDDCRRNVKI